MTTLFRNAQVAAAFAHSGYVVLDFLDESKVATLHGAHRTLLGEVPYGFKATIFSPDVAYRQRVDAYIKAVFDTPLNTIVQAQRSVVGSFLEKRPLPENGEVPLHQDWSFVDEDRFVSLNFWCPLEDVDEQNGCLWVVPGTHRLPSPPRPPFYTTPALAFGEELAASMIPMPMQAGQVLIHDHRLWHASKANRTASSRLAAACVVVPAEADLLHFYRAPFAAADELARYQVDAAFFHKYRPGHAPSGDYPHQRIAIESDHFTPQTLLTWAALVRAAAPI